MNRPRTAHLGAGAVLTAVACVVAAAAHAASPTVLTATLNGRYLHTTSPGSGTATITITATKVCWRFTFRGIDTPNVSGIHVAPPPAAGVHKTSVLPFTATTSKAPGCEPWNRWGAEGPTWVKRILAAPSRFYVIIGTTRYPEGAIGGVLR